MKRLEKQVLHWTQAAVGLTGVGYGVCLYLLRSEDPYAVVNHPLQPDFLHAHVLAAPLAVFGIGFIWQSHVLKKLRASSHGSIHGSSRGTPKRRPTGLLLVGLLLPLVGSGYGVQVLVEEAARRWTGWIHAGLSALWIIAYLFHMLSRGSFRKERAA